MSMNIGILECGLIPEALQSRYDGYGDMFARQFAALLPGASFTVISIVQGAALPAADACDAWVIPGSKHGVYDDLPWIEPLKHFIREAATLQRPMVGVCFGHQIIAEALGGRVEKAAIGFRVGMEQYRTSLGLAGGGETTVAMPAFHQDQIIVQPPHTEIVASSPACAFAALRYTEAPVLTVQFHPEFTRPYLSDLIDVLSKQDVAPGLPENAVLDDTGMKWLAAFLQESSSAMPGSPLAMARR
ncbi:MAG: type 1 glutamine amidotransferase [Ferrovibrio sp.]